MTNIPGCLSSPTRLKTDLYNPLTHLLRSLNVQTIKPDVQALLAPFGNNFPSINKPRIKIKPKSTEIEFEQNQSSIAAHVHFHKPRRDTRGHVLPTGSALATVRRAPSPAPFGG